MRVSDLQGQLPSSCSACCGGQEASQPAVYVVAYLTAAGDVLGLDMRTTFAEAGPSGCAWGEWLTFCVKVCVCVCDCVRDCVTV